MSAENEQGHPIMGNINFSISKAELPGLRDAALRGSPQAAFRLYQFFDMVVLDYKEAAYWASIAAENGHSIGQYALADILLDDTRVKFLYGSDPAGKERARERAIFWLERAASQGNERASERLKRIAR